MLRRCVRDLYSLRPLTRIPRPISSQDPIPTFPTSRSKSSKTSQQSSTQKAVPNPQEEPSQSTSNVSKLVLGTLVVGAAAMAAYQTGYIDLLFKDRKLPSGITMQNDVKMPEDMKTPTEQRVDQTKITLDPNIEIVQDSNMIHPPKDLPTEGTGATEMPTAWEHPTPVEEKETEALAHGMLPVPDEHGVDTKPVPQDNQATERKAVIVNDNTTSESSDEQTENNGSMVVPLQSGPTVGPSYDGHTDTDTQKDPLGAGAVEQKSLAETYLLPEETDVSKDVTSSHTTEKLGKTNIDRRVCTDEETAKEATNEVVDVKTSDDGKVVLDIIEAIHAAERKQAESDAYLFSEEKRKLKEKYEKELKDTRARELMYAEEAAILDKELKKEKLKSAAAIKELQEKAEQNLREELVRKEEEASRQLEKIQELAKAELAAALVKEKASQIEQIAEANLNIDALCMAFYARSEEARQSHSVHKLALGTLALEQALSNGSPIRREVDLLCKSLEGIDKDSLLELALSSLPEEVLDYGSDTRMNLKQKFNSLKGMIRHFSLIPAGGGGILTHAVAHVASSIKIKEDQSGDGIEALLSSVENLVVDGDLSAAADALEGGLQGSEAEEIATGWVKQARKRAIAEQTLSLLHSYAASVTFS